MEDYALNYYKKTKENFMKRILTVSATVALILCMVLSLGIFVSAESTITESDWIQAPEKTLVKCADGDCDHTECDYVYSFAVIGDTQCLVRIDATAFATALKSDPTLTYESYEKAHIKNLYNWILDNKDDKNIQYVLGLGDITEAFQSTSGYYAREWGLSKAAIELLNGKIGYSLVRGNHDITTGFNSAFGKGTQYYSDLEALAKTTDAEGRPMAGFLNPDKIEDTYRKIVIGEHKYIIFTVDYYATEACVTWINEILEENSDYTAIITIHEMLNRDHSFSDAYETTTPAEGLEKENWQEALSSGGNVSPRALWENALSKHANVKLILCGHIDEDDIKTSQLMGENGNTVTLMLIDGQTIDKSIEPVGLVTMFYISADGKVMNVEHISTVRAIAEKNAYLKDVNQFEITIDYSDANGNGWTVTPYGNIPNEFYNSYPLHILVDDDGVEDNDTVYHGGFSDWSGVLDKIEALNQIGGIGSRTSRRIYVLMSKDYSFNGNTDFNLASIPSGVVLDLNGKTLTLEDDGVFLPYYNASSEHTASITLKNGSVSMKGDEFIALQTLEGGAGSSVRIYLEDLSVVWNGTSAPLVSTLEGYAGITANVNLTVKNCSFDTSKEEAQIEILDLDDTSDNNAVKLKLIGGEINGTTLSNTVIASLNKDNDSILFEKNSDGKYLAITLKESIEFGVDYITIAGWKLQFTAMTTTSPYRYEIEAVADHIEQTPYGKISLNVYPLDDYPLALFQNGEIVTAYATWSEFYSNIANVDTSEAKNTVLYFRKDVDHPSSISNNSNMLRTIKYITIDLGGHTLSGSGAQLFSLLASGNKAFTTNIFVTNGTVSALKNNSPVVTFNSTNTSNVETRFNITFTKVTLNRKSGGRLIADAFSSGTYGSINTITFNDCKIDATGVSQLCKLEESNNQNKLDIAIIINGGEIISNKDLVFATFSAERESGKGSPDSLTFGKYNGAYTTYVNSSFPAPDTAFNTVDGGTAYFTLSQTAGKYVLVEDTSNIETTPYGKIPLNVYPLDDYPLALFQNGEIVTAYATWSEFYSNIANVDTSEANNTVLYLRNNIDHASSVANADNKLRTIKHLTIDLNGKTLSASGAQVFSFVVLGNVDFTTNIFVKNGTVSANKANSPIVTFNGAISTSIKASYNITFTDVTLTKTNAGRLLADAFSSGTTGSTNTIVLNNCIIDATGETQLCKLEESNDQNKLDIAIVINGGKIIATKNLVFASFSAEKESGKGSPDSLTFGKYNGAYTTYTNTAYAAPTTAFDTVNEGKAFFKATQTAGEYLLTLCTHSGGMATCSTKAICELCGDEYGAFGACASFSFDSFSGLYLCISCGARCEHTLFNDGKCKLCTYACVHDWTSDGVNATCSVCGETCESSQIPTLDATCSACKSNSAYANGVCTECGTECNHLFNAGGHCSLCGEFGNAITFADGKNGGANASSNNGNSLVVGDGVYTSADGSYKQLWDYRDTNGSLLGRNYVFSAKFTFDDWKYVSGNSAGTTRLLIWANGDVSASTTKFALYMFGNKGKLELSPDHDDASTRMTLELNKEYDIRVAIRSEESSDGIFAHTAEISVNGQLMWTRSFELTAENGMAIRLGDHTPRKTQVKYSVSDNFGIHCIDESINYIGVQEKENANYNADLAYGLRFIFGIDDIYLGDVGVKVEAEMTGSIIYEDVSGELICSSSRTVLNNVLAGGKVCTPGAYGAGYGGNYIALAITDIPLDHAATYTFTLTPYVTYHSGETVFSETSHKITVSFIDGKMNIGYEK